MLMLTGMQLCGCKACKTLLMDTVMHFTCHPLPDILAKQGAGSNKL